LKQSANSSLAEELTEVNHSFDGQNYISIQYPDYLIFEKDTKVKVKSLGEKFSSLNSFFFDYLKEYHIPVAFLKNENNNKLRFIEHKKFPFYVKILNNIDKRTAKIFDKKEYESLNLPLFEYHYGNGKESLVSESHLIAFSLCNYEDLKFINRVCSKINAVLKSFFERRNFLLAEVLCCFGKAEDKVYLVDDFTPRSLKVIPLNYQNNEKWINPFRFSTSSEIKKYTDCLFNLMSS
jgi:phosphoribosylaminoimidazole-succinocarboxamide synthase